jgi:hypothetical protein
VIDVMLLAAFGMAYVADRTVVDGDTWAHAACIAAGIVAVLAFAVRGVCAHRARNVLR